MLPYYLGEMDEGMLERMTDVRRQIRRKMTIRIRVLTILSKHVQEIYLLYIGKNRIMEGSGIRVIHSRLQHPQDGQETSELTNANTKMNGSRVREITIEASQGISVGNFQILSRCTRAGMDVSIGRIPNLTGQQPGIILSDTTMKTVARTIEE